MISATLVIFSKYIITKKGKVHSDWNEYIIESMLSSKNINVQLWYCLRVLFIYIFVTINFGLRPSSNNRLINEKTFEI